MDKRLLWSVSFQLLFSAIFSMHEEENRNCWPVLYVQYPNQERAIAMDERSLLTQNPQHPHQMQMHYNWNRINDAGLNDAGLGDDERSCCDRPWKCGPYQYSFYPQPAYSNRSLECRTTVSAASMALLAVPACITKGLYLCMASFCPCHRVPCPEVCDCEHAWFPVESCCNENFCCNAVLVWSSSLALIATSIITGLTWSPCINQNGCNYIKCTRIQRRNQQPREPNIEGN